jgi:hypothetical protein
MSKEPPFSVSGVPARQIAVVGTDATVHPKGVGQLRPTIDASSDLPARTGSWGGPVMADRARGTVLRL